MGHRRHGHGWYIPAKAPLTPRALRRFGGWRDGHPRRDRSGPTNESIKNEKMYEELRKDGNSKQKAARISNASAAQGKSSVARKGGKSGSYDDWTVAELKKRAKDLGLSGYSSLTKSKLVSKIRNS
jgi:hypothetical protein